QTSPAMPVALGGLALRRQPAFISSALVRACQRANCRRTRVKEATLVDRRRSGDERGLTMVLLHVLPAGLREPRAQVGIGHACDQGGERTGIVAREQQASAPMLDQFDTAADR